MSYTYKKCTPITFPDGTSKDISVIRIEDGACIPFDPERKGIIASNIIY